MPGKDKGKGKSPAENFGEMFKKFGEAMGEIFNDPELKKKAKEFGDSAVNSAKTFGGRFKDEEVKGKFRDFGKATQEFGSSVSDYFSEESKKDPSDPSKKKYEWEEKLDQKMDKFGERAAKAGKELGNKMEESGKKVERYFNETRGGRTVGYAFSIFWGAVFIILFNYYSQFIAYYSKDAATGIWTRYPFLTEDFSRWLPIVTVALAVSIAGNILLIFYDRYLFRQITKMVFDLFGLASTITLLRIFPFDFSVSPNNDLVGILVPVVTILLILVSVGLGIGILVRFIKMVIVIVKRP
jgi:hypothetical protein